MANAFITPGHIAPEALRHLENELVLGNLVHTDYSKEYVAKGETISIRRPTQFRAIDNNLDITGVRQAIEQATIPLTLDQTATIPVELSVKDKTLSFDRFSEDIIKPAMIEMKDKIEQAIASTYWKFYHFGGTPGTAPGTFLSLASMGAVMTDGAIPMSPRAAVHGTDAAVALADGLKGVFVQGKAKTAFEEASIGRYAAFDNYMSVHAPTHTVGVATGSPQVDGNQSTTYEASKATWSMQLVTKGWTNSQTGILRRGDVITINGVFAVNPVSKQSTGRLQTFTVMADANSGGSTGPATLTISPPIITSGPYQTVTTQAANNQNIVVKTGTGGTPYKQSLLFHPKAIALVSRPLSIENGAGVKTATRSGNKVTISVTEFINGNTLAHTIRFDMLFKADVIDPRLGARLTN